MNISIPNSKILQHIPYAEFWKTIEQLGTPIVESMVNNCDYYNPLCQRQ